MSFSIEYRQAVFESHAGSGADGGVCRPRNMGKEGWGGKIRVSTAEALKAGSYGYRYREPGEADGSPLYSKWRYETLEFTRQYYTDLAFDPGIVSYVGGTPTLDRVYRSFRYTQWWR